MIKAIIFDLDGTLLDTSEDIRAVLNSSLEKFGLPALNCEDVLSFIGNGAAKLVECAVGKHTEKFGEVYADYSKNFAECDNERTSLYCGEDEVLRELKKRGIRLAILTNKPERATKRVYEKFLKKYSFDAVVGQGEKFALKPDPAAVNYILGVLKAEPEECLFVGDGETDVETAMRAGVRGVSALWGYRTKSRLEAAGATCFAEKFADIFNFL